MNLACLAASTSAILNAMHGDPVTPTRDLTPRPSFFNLQGNSTNSTPVTPTDVGRTPTLLDFNLREQYHAEKAKKEDLMPTLSDTLSRSPSPVEFYDEEDNSDDEEGNSEGEEDYSTLIEFQASEDNLNNSQSTGSDIGDEASCPGQRIEWNYGSIWEMYAYQLHAPWQHKSESEDSDESSKIPGVPWELLSISNGCIYIRARNLCSGYLETPDDIDAGVCLSCSKLRTLPAFVKFVRRAQTTPKPNTPWIYLNYNQLKELLLAQRKRIYERDQKVYIKRPYLSL